MRLPALLVVLALALMAPASVWACEVPGPDLRLLHASPPTDVDSGDVVLRVTADAYDEDTMVHEFTRARVLDVVRGPPPGAWVEIDVGDTPCNRLFGSGQTGFLIGRPIRSRDGVMRIRPRYAPP